MIGCIVQARMGSSRLPGKVMKKVGDKFLLDYVLEQLKSSKNIEKIIVATTTLTNDDIICQYVSSKNIKFFRGSSDDVLDRYYQCAKKFTVDTIVRITADNPLIDPNIIDRVINEYSNKKVDYVTNTLDRTFPYGTEVEIFSFKTLEKAWKNAIKSSEREHVTPFIRDPKNKFILMNIKHSENHSYLRYTVDRMSDLKLVKEIIKNISTRPIVIQDIIKLYKQKPEIFEINKNIKHDGYESSLKKDNQYFKSQETNGTINEKN
jgi:spore coat polysaccharide biosynthesis protein SpsF (cytidylyltransferase family)